MMYQIIMVYTLDKYNFVNCTSIKLGKIEWGHFIQYCSLHIKIRVQNVPIYLVDVSEHFLWDRYCRHWKHKEKSESSGSTERECNLEG